MPPNDDYRKRKLDLIEKGKLVDQMRYGIMEGEKNIKHIPLWVERVLDSEAWKVRFVCGVRVECTTFKEFIETAPMDGMGWGDKASQDMIASLLRNDLGLLERWNTLLKDEPGGDRKSEDYKIKHDNIMHDQSPKAVQGTSLAYTLDRLKREAPELFAKVVAGEMSANAAAIAAGYRKQQSPLNQLRKAWKKASKTERATFYKEIADGY